MTCAPVLYAGIVVKLGGGGGGGANKNPSMAYGTCPRVYSDL